MEKYIFKIFITKKSGFTLAETLITLGIIGIIASLVIPSLMNNIQDAQFKTAYKKAFSVASQALNSANQQYAIVSTTAEGDANITANFLTFMDQFKVSKKCIDEDRGDCWDPTGEEYGYSWGPGSPDKWAYGFIDSSGMAWSMYWNCSSIFFVDTNGSKKPNQWGKDRFVLEFVNSNNQINTGIPIKVVPYPDNEYYDLCYKNKCETQQNYFGTSWLYN